jgi:hypothetical protein
MVAHFKAILKNIKIVPNNLYGDLLSSLLKAIKYYMIYMSFIAILNPKIYYSIMAKLKLLILGSPGKYITEISCKISP